MIKRIIQGKEAIVKLLIKSMIESLKNEFESENFLIVVPTGAAVSNLFIATYS